MLKLNMIFVFCLDLLFCLDAPSFNMGRILEKLLRDVELG